MGETDEEGSVEGAGTITTEDKGLTVTCGAGHSLTSFLNPFSWARLGSSSTLKYVARLRLLMIFEILVLLVILVLVQLIAGLTVGSNDEKKAGGRGELGDISM